MKKEVLEWDSNLASNIVKQSEGLRLKAYKCPASILTIGYGHTAGVKAGQVITEAQAEELLENDLIQTQDELALLVKVPLTQGQFVALMDFVFNLGLTKCKRYTLFDLLNAGDYKGASEMLPKYCKAGTTTLPGLVTRRAREKAAFDLSC